MRTLLLFNLVFSNKMVPAYAGVILPVAATEAK
jgi:hypothetical protein